MGVHHKPSVRPETEEKDEVYICERCEKSYEGLQKLNSHFCDPRPPQKIHCEQCPYVTSSVGDIANHFQDNHKEKERCEFCDFEAETHEAMVDHRIEQHEDLGLLNQLSFQQKYVNESFDHFRNEMSEVVKGIVHAHTAIKQELFIIRKNQVAENRIIEVEKSMKVLST